MTFKEQGNSPTDLEIVSANDFIEKPFESPWKAYLKGFPDTELLKKLPEIRTEFGFVYKDRKWMIIKGIPLGIGIHAEDMPKDANILLHSHPKPLPAEIFERYGIKKSPYNIDTATPSTGDIYNCSPTAKNFIASVKGLTQYSFTLPVELRDEIFIDPVESTRAGAKMFKDQIRSGFESHKYYYKLFLGSIGAKFQVHPWEDITEEILAELFYGKPVSK